jgi:hypothetical protein
VDPENFAATIQRIQDLDAKEEGRNAFSADEDAPQAQALTTWIRTLQANIDYIDVRNIARDRDKLNKKNLALLRK